MISQWHFCDYFMSLEISFSNKWSKAKQNLPVSEKVYFFSLWLLCIHQIVRILFVFLFQFKSTEKEAFDKRQKILSDLEMLKTREMQLEKNNELSMKYAKDFFKIHYAFLCIMLLLFFFINIKQICIPLTIKYAHYYTSWQWMINNNIIHKFC